MFDAKEGSPFDRGMADSYYRRSRKPHFRIITKQPYSFEEIYDLTESQICEYNKGYEFNESIWNFKNYEGLDNV